MTSHTPWRWPLRRALARAARAAVWRAAGAVAGSLLVGATAGGCGTVVRRLEGHGAIDSATRERMAREGAEALRAVGRPPVRAGVTPPARFDVEGVRAAGGKDVDLVDDFSFHNRLYFLSLDADVRFVSDVRARARDEMVDRMGAPDWQVEETLDDLQLFDLLGAAPRRAGTKEKLAAAAVFVDLEPGWRFERLDARR